MGGARGVEMGEGQPGEDVVFACGLEICRVLLPPTPSPDPQIEPRVDCRSDSDRSKTKVRFGRVRFPAFPHPFFRRSVEMLGCHVNSRLARMHFPSHAQQCHGLCRSLTEPVALSRMHKVVHAGWHFAAQASHIVLVVHVLDRFLDPLGEALLGLVPWVFRQRPFEPITDPRNRRLVQPQVPAAPWLVSARSVARSAAGTERSAKKART